MILGRPEIMRAQSFKIAITLLCALSFSFKSFSCECGAPGPACAYISAAPVVFVGTPIFSNDDGSGTFRQQTLYKFTVDEIFKGLPEGTKAVWVDPGSYTSCYAEYKLGVKLLVFASAGRFVPADTAAMTTAAPSGKKKPLPPGFDPEMAVYYVPECTGTREADFAGDDIAWLRSWKKGDTRTRIQGIVVDSLGWPLSGVEVIANGVSGGRISNTDSAGAFGIEPVEPGQYNLSAKLANYHLAWKPQVDVPQHGCGYLRLPMDSPGVLSGTVVEKGHGKPVAGLELDILRLRGTEATIPDNIGHETTGTNGFYRYKDLPAGDYLIGVNLWSEPNVDTPYARTYAPGVPDRDQAHVIHLAAGQKLSGIRLQLPPRLRFRTVHVQVKWPDGSSVGHGVSVTTDESESGVTDIEETKQDGSVSVQCFAARSCTIEAKKWLTKPGEDTTPQITASLPEQIGDAPISITLILTAKRSRWNE
jgi:hypothetical protein